MFNVEEAGASLKPPAEFRCRRSHGRDDCRVRGGLQEGIGTLSRQSRQGRISTGFRAGGEVFATAEPTVILAGRSQLSLYHFSGFE